MKYALFLIVAALVACGPVGLPKSGTTPFYLGVVNVDEGRYVNNEVADTKVGRACARNILGLVATGDASVDAAKRNGSVSQVHTIDREIFGLRIYFPIFAKSCTVIRGT